MVTDSFKSIREFEKEVADAELKVVEAKRGLEAAKDAIKRHQEEAAAKLQQAAEEEALRFKAKTVKGLVGAYQYILISSWLKTEDSSIHVRNFLAQSGVKTLLSAIYKLTDTDAKWWKYNS